MMQASTEDELIVMEDELIQISSEVRLNSSDNFPS
jgi:hypothetical protein